MTARDSVAGQVLATGDGRQRHVPRHREPGAGRERGPERHELAGVEHGPCRVEATASPWWVSARDVRPSPGRA